MIIDVSAYQGQIKWGDVLKYQSIDRVILRSTVKSGALDSRFMENYNGLLQNNFRGFLDVYKFTYARTYADALKEAESTFKLLKSKGVLNAINTFWLDIENIGDTRFTSAQAAEVIGAYNVMAKVYTVNLGIYANYDYLKTVIPEWASCFYIWVARYNSFVGDIKPFEPIMWQYTSDGVIRGISGRVDLSRYV